MCDVEVEALVTTMNYSLAEEESETPGDTLRDVETEASGNTLVGKIAEVKAERVGETPADVKGASLV